MNPLITAHNISKAHGTQILFDDITFSLTEGDRIGLIGPNGSGKSSLMKILAGIEQPDSGYISRKQNLKAGYASQSPDFPSAPIEQFLIDQAQHTDRLTAQTRAKILLGKGEFTDISQDASLLSGGMKKRLDILRALMDEPDFLLLDEPTNHLDLEGILWLENFLKRIKTPFLVISHDRYFLENVTNEIIELNKCYPKGILITTGNMSAYMKQKEDYLNTLEKKQRELAFKVREEVNWLRTSPKARTTKSQSRIQQAYRLIDELAEVKQRKKIETAGIDFTSSERQTRKMLAAKNISKTLGNKELFKHLDVTLSPGTRLGIVGKNGTGKTTLLKVLAGEIPQDMGTIKYADDLRIVYFDQHRETVPSDVTLKEALCPYGDTVNYRGQEIHVNGWAKRFLFSDKLNLPVRFLSGGERARILIAKLMLQPADILFLDEPTNDLDIPTLEIIEESLNSFAGAVVLISHDRCLMDRICTNILGLSENHEHHYLASFDQWEHFSQEKKKEKKVEKPTTPQSPKKEVKKSLSYNEKRDLENMEQKIFEAEAAVEKLQEELKVKEGDHELYSRMAEAQHAVEVLYQHWQDLLDRSK
jgi:ATP-binding cassette subfamily F protein uup